MATVISSIPSFPIKYTLYPPSIQDSDRRPLRRNIHNSFFYEFDVTFDWLTQTEKEAFENAKDQVIQVQLGSSWKVFILDNKLNFVRTGPNRFSLSVKMRQVLDPGA